MRRTRTAAFSVPTFCAPAALPGCVSLRVSAFVCRTQPAKAARPAAHCMVVPGSGDDDTAHVPPAARTYTNYGSASSNTSAQIQSQENPEHEGADEVDSGAAGDDESATEEEGQPLDGRVLIGAGILLFALTVGGVAAVTGGVSQETWLGLAEWFETLGPWAVFLYAGIYFVLELVAVPALPLTLGSGYLFGVVKGTVTVSLAGSAAAAVSFLIARYGLRDSITKLAQRYPRFQALDRAIGRQGFKIVLLLRCSPLLPFAISNYLYGLTSVDFPAYIAGSWLGMLPGTIAYVSAGAAVNALTELGDGKSALNPLLLVLGLGATAAAVTTIGKIASEAIEEGEEEEVGQN